MSMCIGIHYFLPVYISLIFLIVSNRAGALSKSDDKTDLKKGTLNIKRILAVTVSVTDTQNGISSV